MAPRSAKVAMRAVRSVFGRNSAVEKWARDRYLGGAKNEVRIDKGDGWVQMNGSSFVIVSESPDLPEPRRGILLRGGCDLPSTYTSAPLMRSGIKGTVAIYRQLGGTGSHRSDQLLQTLDNIDMANVADAMEKLQLRAPYFQPIMFEPDFEIRKHPQAGRFPTSVVVMSISQDEVRQLYRHKEHGYVVDPGGWWLNQDLERVLDDLSAVEWVRNHFTKIGRLRIEQSMANNTRLIGEVRQRTGAEVVFYNTMVIDPASTVHNYQWMNAAHASRRREFAIALAELSARLAFPVVDVDRLLKSEGVKEQVDFAHFPVERMQPIGAEFHRIIKELGVA